MSEFQAFFAKQAAIEVTENIVVSNRFKTAEGQAIPWQVRSITEEENSELRKSATKRIKGKGGSYTTEFNHEDYLAKMTVACVVYPNLKDVELQKSYDAVGAEVLLRKMLLPGEFSELLQKVQALNGFDKEMNELIDEVKN